MTCYRKVALLVSILSSPAVLYAAVLPGSAQPEQISRTMMNTTPDNPILPGGNSSIELPLVPNISLNPQALQLEFKLNDIVLVGNTVFSTAELRPLYSGDLHHIVTVKRILEIVQSITDYYHSHGYITSRAVLSVQETKNGNLLITIVEGKIDKVVVTGNPKKSVKLVQRFGDNIAANAPLQAKNVEYYTLLANEIPGTTVRTVIKPSSTVNGASDFYLLTEHKNMSAYISYDNYRTRYIGPQQITVGLAANSFLFSGDEGQFVFAKTPKGQELTFLNASYDWALDAKGNRMTLGVIHDKTHPLFVLQPFRIDGTDNNYYTTIALPQIRASNQNLTLFINANYENTHVTTFNQKLYTDHIRSISLGAAYNLSDRWRGTNSVYADVRQGIPIWGYTTATNTATALTSRPGGHAVYTKLDLALGRQQPLFGNFSLYGLIKGQYGFQALLAAEQFAYGGMELGRGYDIAELLGDRAVAGSIEARYDCPASKLRLSQLQFYAFYDIGKVWNFYYGSLPQNQSAASTGIGTRFAFNNYISGNVTWAQPLTKTVAAEELIGRGRKPRVFFSLTASM